MQDVLILMATYNGRNFIKEQLDSIVNQSYKSWSLYISDDGSDDGTIDIINSFAGFDNRIKVFTKPESRKKGPCNNFSFLTEQALISDSQIFFFCDQDDVWQSDKIDIIRRVMLKHGDKPLLVHHDLAVVDEDLNLIAESFCEFMRLTPEKTTLNSLLSRNEVTGCAMAISKSLLHLVSPIPTGAIMHDWWCAIIAAGAGKIVFKNDKLVKYRQHARNAVGAKNIFNGMNPLTNWKSGWQRGNQEFKATVKQATLIYEHAQMKRIAPKFRQTYEYSTLLTKSKFERYKLVRKYDFLANFWLVFIVSIIRLMTIKVSD